jgi:hypothetical protein
VSSWRPSVGGAFGLLAVRASRRSTEYRTPGGRAVNFVSEGKWQFYDSDEFLIEEE